MRRPQPASGFAAVTASLLVVTLFAAPVDAARAPAEVPSAHTYDAASRTCTPWVDEFVPPPTIRVLRTQRDLVAPEVVGTVQEVDFRSYVATTMAVEWPEHYPLETIKAGAIATKQFPWFHILHPRGKKATQPDGSEVCYDVVDTSLDQYYYPEKYGVGLPEGPGGKILKALELTWDVSLRKYKQSTQGSRMFLTGYRAGTSDQCGADANGFKLFHRSTKACGKAGLKYEQILRLYFKPNLEVVTAGRNDVIGSKHGDATAMVRNDAGLLTARIWAVGPRTASFRPAWQVVAADVIGYRSSDVNGDGKDDLVWVQQTGPRTGRIKISFSDGNAYGPEQVWYDGDMGAPLGGARLLVGDFHADGRRDIAVLAKGDSGKGSQLIVFRKRVGDALKGPDRWWSGVMNLDTARKAWAGDVTGDGRADLIIRQDPPGGGVKVRVAITRSPLPKAGKRMGALKDRFVSPGMNPAKVKMVAGDANRDGREDLLMLIGGGGRARVERLQGQALGGMKRVPVWTAPRSANIAVEKTRVGAADVDYDGLTDLVLYIKRGSGTRIRVLKTRYDDMRPGKDIQRKVVWANIRPY